VNPMDDLRFGNPFTLRAGSSSGGSSMYRNPAR
jgi:hypothetical protein